MLRVNKRNYYGKHANQVYMGSTQFRAFEDCPARALAMIDGQYTMSSDALAQGQYLDALFEGSAERYEAEHRLRKKDGSLLKVYDKVLEVFQIIRRDPLMYKLCTGKQQKIMTGDIAGVPFKIMIDSMLPDRTVDRKFMRDFKDIWVDGQGYRPWWAAYGYDRQAAIYAEIRRQNEGEELKPFELVAISKEDTPDKAWVRFTKETLEATLEVIKQKAPIFQAYKEGLIPAPECGHCAWCISKKMLTEPEEV